MLRHLLNTLISPPGKTIQFSELRYRRLFETAQDGILILDAASGKITDVNPFLKHLLGYSQAELVGKQLWEIGVFKDIVASKETFHKLQNEGYVRYKNLPLQKKNGENITAEFISNSYLVGNEKVIQCNIRDITERKKAEERLQTKTLELEELSTAQEKTKKTMLNVMEDLEEAKKIIEIEKAKDEAMLESIGEGLIAVDNEAKVMMVNKVAESLLGLKANELLGKKITNLTLEDEHGTTIPLRKRPTTIALSEGKTTSGLYYFVKKDKTKFPLVINATPVKLKEKTIGLIETIRDVTQEKKIDKAKSEFVSIASHQLRTPLGIIKWYLEALENEEYMKKSPVTVQKYFDEIYKSNERVLSLVRDLLSVSRIEEGQVKNVPKSVTIIPLVKAIVEQMNIMAQKKGVVLSLIIRDVHIPPIEIDILRLHEVIENLISNAIAYTDALGTVTVLITIQDTTLSLSVKDTGMGISAQDQKKLFTKFFRSEKAIGHNPSGSGLGLYVVKSYVEGWGGTISVESEENKGSTFTISLPMNQKKSMELPA